VLPPKKDIRKEYHFTVVFFPLAYFRILCFCYFLYVKSFLLCVCVCVFFKQTLMNVKIRSGMNVTRKQNVPTPRVRTIALVSMVTSVMAFFVKVWSLFCCLLRWASLCGVCYGGDGWIEPRTNGKGKYESKELCHKIYKIQTVVTVTKLSEP